MTLAVDEGEAPGDFVGWADALLDAVGVGVLLLDGRTRGDLDGAMEGSGAELWAKSTTFTGTTAVAFKPTTPRT